MKKLSLFLIVLYFNLSAFESLGQMVITQSNNATLLAQQLAGSGVTISNATLVCPTSGGVRFSGTFANAPAGLGITDGVILATGKVTEVKSASGSTFFASTSANAAGNANLNSLLSSMGETYTTKDACVLDFDITVTGDSLHFNYVMGSEEYPSFVCSSYNDIFGFFISGPNPAGGNYVNKNVALIPGTNIPVSVNTVNNGGSGFAATCYNGTYSNFMNPNPSPISSVPTISYNQLTRSIKASAATIPCQQYHFKLAIADGGDDAYDSGVFLEAGSFTSNAVVIGAASVLGPGFDQAVEGCVDGVFTLRIDTPYSIPVMVGYQISGTATNGVDYAFIPDSILIPAGDTTVDIHITVFADGIVEGVETVILTPYTACGTLGDPSVLEIIDFYPHSIAISDTFLCSPGVVTLTATGGQYYTWSDSTLVTNPHSATTTTNAPLNQSTTFYVDGILGTCTFTDSVSIRLSQSAPTFHFTDISCPGANDGAYWVELNPEAAVPFTYAWTFVPTSLPSDSAFNNFPPGFQICIATDAYGCTFTGPFHDFVNAGTYVYNKDTVGISCAGADDGAICIYNMTNGTYTATVDTNGTLYGNYNFTMNSDTFCIYNLAPGTYSVSFLNDTTGCGASFTSSLSNPSGLNYNRFIKDVNCAGADDGEICIYNVTNGNYTADVLLNGVALPQYNFTINSDTFCINNLAPGAYQVTVTNTTSTCNAVFFDNISEPNALDASITVMGSGLCAGGSVDSLVSVVSGGTTNYTYAWSSGETTANIYNTPFGTYTLTVTDAHNCVDTASVTLLTPSSMALNILQDSVLCFNGNSGRAYVNSLTGGNPPFTYNWNTTPAQANDTAFNLTAGQYILTVTDINLCSVSDTVNVLQPIDSISISLNTNVISCFGGDTCITATVSGGKAPYTYLWNDAAGTTTKDACGLVAGTYTLVATDANGCTNSKTITITQVAEIVLTMDSVNLNCYGANNGSATVTAVGGSGTYTYSWNDAAAQTTATASNLAQGNYTVLVSDVSNPICTSSKNVTITEPSDSISISLNNLQNVACFGTATGAIDVNVSGGTTPYTYAWTGGSTSQDLTAATANTYTLTVTDANLCSQTFTRTISQPTALVLVLDSSKNISCFGGNNGKLSISVSGGKTPYTYAWSNSATTQDLTGLTAGVYTIIVTDSNNCTISGTYTLTQPNDVSISFNYSDYHGKNISCFGESDGTLKAVVTGGTAPFTYAWSNATTANPATNLSAGVVYTVTVKDARGCTFSKAANALTQPTALTVAKDSTNLTCAGYKDGTAKAIATGGTKPYTYSWSGSGSQTTATATKLPAGTYTCTVKDANGCSQVIQVKVSEPLPIVVNTIMDSVKCWGNADGKITINASGGNGNSFEYSIDNGKTYQSSNVFKGLTAGVYSDILVRQANTTGCVSTKLTQIVQQPDPMFIYISPDDTTIELQMTVSLSLNVDPSTGYYSGGSYSTADITNIAWSPTSGLNCSDCLNPKSLVYNDVEYTATVLYSPYGCEASATAIINVENNLKFFIPNSFSPQGDGINDVHYVYGKGFKTIYIAIFNRIGEKVFESNNQSDGWNGSYKGVMQNPGVYSYYFKGTYLDGKEVNLKGSITLIR